MEQMTDQNGTWSAIMATHFEILILILLSAHALTCWTKNELVVLRG
jgi:hypothetical protein